MFRYALFASVFAFAFPAAAQAQHQGHPASPPAASQPPASQPPASPTPGAQTRAPSAAEVGQHVQAEFRARDRDGNGSLNQAEFSGWLGELMARAPGQTAPPAASALAAAFTQADIDRSQSVSPAEMTALLSRTR
jgi:hypothetical protein